MKPNSAEALAPSATKTVENPATNNAEATITSRRALRSSSCDNRSTLAPAR